MAWSKPFFYDPELLRRQFSEREENMNSKESFWNNDEKWTTIYKSIEDAKLFIRALNSTKVVNWVKHIKDPFHFQHLPLPSFNSIFSTFSIDLGALKLNKPNPCSGEKVQIVSCDPEVFSAYPKCLLPSFCIEDPAKPISGDLCRICECPLRISCLKMHCTSCGIPLCELCGIKARVLHLGCNEKVPVCNPCSKKCDEINAILWMKQAEYAMKCGENLAARLFLTIGHQYSTNYPEKNFLVPYKEVEKSASELQDYKTKILCLKYQGVKDFQWGVEAHKMCQQGDHMYPFALFCLKLIVVPNSKDAESKWDVLGDRFGAFHEDLALYCYNQGSLTNDKWIEKAKMFDELGGKEDKQLYYKISYHCLQQVIQKMRNVNQLVAKRGIIDQLFDEGRYRLALLMMKGASLPMDPILDLLNRWYNSVDNTSMMVTVIAIIKYILTIFDPMNIDAIPKTEPAFLMVSQIYDLSPLPIHQLIERINRISNYESLHIPLALLRSKTELSWADLGKIGNECQCPRAALVMQTLGAIEGTFMSAEFSSRLNINEESWIEELEMD